MSRYGADTGKMSKPGKIFEHYCNAEGCKAWGSFGYKTKYGQLWFCMVHREEGEKVLNGK